MKKPPPTSEVEILRSAMERLKQAIEGRASLEEFPPPVGVCMDASMGIVGLRVDHGGETRTCALYTKAIRLPGRFSQAVESLDRLRVEIARPRPPSSDQFDLIAIPHMPPKAAKMCRQQGLLFVDLCGNMYIDFPPWLLIDISGRPNVFRDHRPTGAFSKKGSRITRALLNRPSHRWRQVELSRVVRVSEGYTSKILQAMEADGFVRRQLGTVEVIDAEGLLESWRVRAKIRQGDRTTAFFWKGDRPNAEHRLALDLLSSELPDLKIALTGPSAANVLAPHADHRITGLYTSRSLTSEELASHGIELVDEGENLWLIVPRDDGVFDFLVPTEDGVPLVGAVQAYVDLWSFPGRVEEAAAVLLEKQILGHLR